MFIHVLYHDIKFKKKLIEFLCRYTPIKKN